MKPFPKELITKVQMGDDEAFEALYQHFKTPLSAVINRVVRNEEDREDSLQDTFKTVHTKVRKFKGESEIGSWLYRIAMNCALMKLRKDKKHKEKVDPESLMQWCGYDGVDEVSFRTFLDSIEDESLVDPIDFIEAKKVQTAVRKAISRLKPDYKEIILLTFFEELTNKEISTFAGISIPAVKSRLFRGKRELEKRLEKILG